jgi:hypothetical protein
MWGKRHPRYKTPDGWAPPMISVRRSSLCYPLVASSSSKDTLFGVCTLLQRVGYKAMVQKAFSERRKEECVRRYAVRVVEAVLWTTVAVSVVFIMYMLVRRWL